MATYFDVDDKNFVLQEQIKLKENAMEASSKMLLEKEKDFKNRIEELQSKLNEPSQNSQEVKEFSLLQFRYSNKLLSYKIKTLLNHNSGFINRLVK